MRRVYVHLDKEGKINNVFGTLKKAHSNLIENREGLHRAFSTFERFFKRFGDVYHITDFEGNGNGTIEKFDIH